MINSLKAYFTNRQSQEREALSRRQRIPGEIEAARKAYHQLFADDHHYLDPTEIKNWQEQWSHLITADLPFFWGNKKKQQNREILSDLLLHHNLVRSLEQAVMVHNDEFIAFRRDNLEKMIHPLERKSLEPEELSVLLRECHNHLVFTRGNTRKSLLLLGKAKFLLLAKKCAPEEILVLAETAAVALSKAKRIRRETGYDIAAMTFFELGKQIVTAAPGGNTRITKIDRTDFIRSKLAEEADDPLYRKRLIEYLCYYQSDPQAVLNFDAPGDDQAHRFEHPPVTLNHEQVHSDGDREIANFLFAGGLAYCYQSPVAGNPGGSSRSEFYLPDEGIRIVFGDGNGQQSGPDDQALQQDNDATLVALSAADYHAGRLVEILEARLTALGIGFAPQTDEALWQRITGEEPDWLTGLVALYDAVFGMVRQTGAAYETLFERNLKNRGRHFRRHHRIFEMIEPVFKAYEKVLQENREIDPQDLLPLACSCLDANAYSHPYRFVLVDEDGRAFQQCRGLLEAMRRQHDFELFWVAAAARGDERIDAWGEALIQDFRACWAAPQISKIEAPNRISLGGIEARREFVVANSGPDGSQPMAAVVQDGAENLSEPAHSLPAADCF